MAHKTLVGGTVYEIGGGKDLIGGTVYEKDHGKTLVGGTAYEVGFAPSGATVTLTYHSGYEGYNVTIGGQRYSSPTVLTVPIGTVVEFPGINQATYHYRTGSEETIYGDQNYTVTGDANIYITGTKPVPTFTVYVANVTEL